MTEQADDLLSLPRGYDLQGFVIKEKLGSGGFGIVYLADSRSLGVQVAIKEYLPATLATRTQGQSVIPNSSKRADAFEKGRARFIEEGRMLARLHDRHDIANKQVLYNIVQVLQIIEANGTAYLVTKFYGRQSLQDYLETHAQPDARFVVPLLEKMLNVLDVVHAAGLIHRDIAPDNILLTENGEPVLIDFGGARDYVNRQSRGSDLIGKPGYTPIEQYDEEHVATLPVGPWSDLYALAATFYHLITGEKPIAACFRFQNDRLVTLMQKRPTGYPTALLMGLDWCLRYAPADRPQTVEKLREVLSGTGKPPQAGSPKPPNEIKKQKSLMRQVGWAAVLVVLLLGMSWWKLSPSPLNPPMATLSLQVSPEASTIDIEGMGPYLPGMSFRAGQRLKLTMSAAGFQPQSLDYVVAEGENTLTAQLVPVEVPVVAPVVVPVAVETMPTLKVTSNAAALVITLVNVKPKYREGMEVEKGKALKVRVHSAGYQSLEKTLTPDAGENVLHFELEKIDADWALSGLEMVAVPAGSYRMGDLSGEGGEDEKPVHTVDIRSFRLSKYEVTFGQYDRYCKSAGVECPEDEGWGRGNRPVINVSWEEAQGYIRWLNGISGGRYRLPSEAEWEYAARAGTTTEYPWGSALEKGNANCDNDLFGDGYEYTSPVGSFKPNRWGLHDMVGNVWEWVQDCWHEDYSGAPSNGSAWTSGSCADRVLRGGSWSSTNPAFLRSFFRFYYSSGYRYYSIGFRLAQDF